MSEDFKNDTEKYYFEEDHYQAPEERNGIHVTDAQQAVRILLQWAGDDPDREGLKDTPDRVVRSYTEFFKGYTVNPAAILNKTFSDVENYKDMVVLRDIRMESYCEHHLVPFIGIAHVGYIPNKRVVGISKLARVVEAYSKRLQIQEALTQQICLCIMTTLEPLGSGVVIEAEHQCMSTRGVHKPGVKMVTSSMMGNFEELEIQRKFLSRISR